MTETIRIGTRGSPLALIQANLVKAALCNMHGFNDEQVAIVPVQTAGDREQDRPLAEIGGKALWTKELDYKLEDGDIDCAVHSMKDVETIRPADFVIAAMLPRADARDRLIGAESIDALDQGATIGTSSPRRAAQVLNLRPDLNIQALRGNVDTRIEAVAFKKIDATLLAGAGLDRLGRYDVGTPLPIKTVLPAAQQGAIGIEIVAAREDLRELFHPINDPLTHRCVSMERAMLEALGADCHSPVAAHARGDDEALRLDVQLLTHDGRQTLTDNITSSPDTSEDAARRLAIDMLRRAPAQIRSLFAR